MASSAKRNAASGGRPARRVPRVLIIGGGPGGMAAGIWAARLGLRAELLEAGSALGGQILEVTSPITDYPGVQDVDGPALAERFADHLRATGVSVRFDCPVASLDPDSGLVRTAAGEELCADAVIVATGATRGRLGLAREAELVGRGVSYSVSKDRLRAKGQIAVVVGGGDSAMEGAVLLAAHCPEVHVVHRDASIARLDFLAAAQQEPRVELHPGRQIRELRGREALEAVVLDDGSVLPCAWLFIRIGVVPRVDFVPPSLPRDERGYLAVDRHQRSTGVVYAVGDVCSPSAMAVSVAVGQAMIACKHIQSRWIRAAREA